jgi:D-glycero-D-manno-heptose 1,7-bisphosphate phosphatase
LQRLKERGYLLVVITNQSGLARGLFRESDLTRMHHHLHHTLAARGVWLDGIYHCPHHPDGVVPHLAVECECRKPRPGMLRQAANDLGVDLSSSWFVGDILDDVEAGNRAGCRTVLVDLGTEAPPATSLRCPTAAAADTAQALDLILGDQPKRALVTPDVGYIPRGWSLGDAGWSLSRSGTS